MMTDAQKKVRIDSNWQTISNIMETLIKMTSIFTETAESNLLDAVTTIFKYCAKNKLGLVVLFTMRDGDKFVGNSFPIFTCELGAWVEEELVKLCDWFDNDRKWPNGKYVQHTLLIVKWESGQPYTHLESQKEFVLSQREWNGKHE